MVSLSNHEGRGILNPRSGFAPRRVGILGGSFNPAHEGHRQISLAALKRLGLDEVWWLVSPQNPLKPVGGMAPIDRRLAVARAVARHPRIRVTDIESHLGTRFTADTLVKLVKAYPRTRFVWLMGADNLSQIARWERWTQIFHAVAIAVFNRPTYCFRALSGMAARRFARRRLAAAAAASLARKTPPAWVFLFTRLNPISASAIRARRSGRRQERTRRNANREVTP
ncbi:MAG: nicotinate-nucleotide adenylyltransferase [Alphaproteobacteria bacterium]|nr:nicotinate-nucleotide adenylyltransferase [Alphaproteobacteria bacterium]